MAPNPSCAALSAAMTKQGKTYATLAAETGLTEQRVTDICTGAVTATAAEFSALTKALNITEAPPADSAHATK